MLALELNSRNGARDSVSPKNAIFFATFAAFSFFVAGCGSPPIVLNPPQTVASAPRAEVTPIDFEPITLREKDNAIVKGDFDFAPPPVNDVLTSAIRSELRTRAFHSDDKAKDKSGYDVKCRLDRFAFRTDTELRYAIALLYVDLNCTVLAKGDGSIAWRGELRGRAMAAGKKNDFDHEDSMWQAFADRTMSDVTRELASDLGTGALDLRGTPGARAFANDDAEKAAASIDDTPLGLIGLAEEIPETKRHAVSELRSRFSVTRAAAWNAVALSSFPDEPWIGGIDTLLDEDAYVRFYQYKALARHGSKATLAEVHRAHKKENQDLLKEFLKDLIASDGLTFPRQARTPQEAQTTTMSGEETTP